MESDDSTPYFARKNHKEVRKELEQSPGIFFQWLQNNCMEINTYTSHLILSGKTKINT